MSVIINDTIDAISEATSQVGEHLKDLIMPEWFAELTNDYLGIFITVFHAILLCCAIIYIVPLVIYKILWVIQLANVLGSILTGQMVWNSVSIVGNLILVLPIFWTCSIWHIANGLGIIFVLVFSASVEILVLVITYLDFVYISLSLVTQLGFREIMTIALNNHPLDVLYDFQRAVLRIAGRPEPPWKGGDTPSHLIWE